MDKQGEHKILQKGVIPKKKNKWNNGWITMVESTKVEIYKLKNLGQSYYSSRFNVSLFAPGGKFDTSLENSIHHTTSSDNLRIE